VERRSEVWGLGFTIMMERRVQKVLGNDAKELLKRLNRKRMKIRGSGKCVEDPSVASLYLSVTYWISRGRKPSWGSADTFPG
jgi:hypothetical protein